MSKIEAVIFDAGGVLHASNSVVTDDLARELELEQATLEAIWREQIPQLGSGKIDEADFWKQVHNKHGIREVDVAENLLGRAFTEALTPHAEVIALIQQLGKQGVRLAVLSNTIEPHAKALREAGLYDGFERLFLSHEVGMRKPAEGIYRYVLKELALNPEQTVFVDDDPENVEAASEIGIKGIVYSNPKQLLDDLRQLIPELALPDRA